MVHQQPGLDRDGGGERGFVFEQACQSSRPRLPVGCFCGWDRLAQAGTVFHPLQIGLQGVHTVLDPACEADFKSVRGESSFPDPECDPLLETVTGGKDAITICKGSVSITSGKVPNLVGRWKLRIFSPFSGDNVLAECPFE